MRIQTMHKALITVLLLAGVAVVAAPVSRVTNFSDGDVLTASQLNGEFNNVIGGVNSINNAQIATNAAIGPEKIGATIKGSGISRDASTGALSAKVDTTSVEIVGDNIQIKDGGVTSIKLADDAVTSAKIGDEEVKSANIEDGAVTFIKGYSRLPTEWVGSFLAEGLVGYNDITSAICNSGSCDSSTLTDSRIGLTVQGNRPILYQGSPIPGTTGYLRIIMNSLAPGTGSGGIDYEMIKSGGSTSPIQGQTVATYFSVNTQFMDLPCSQINNVFIPDSSGNWTFALRFKDVSPGTNVNYSIVNCRVTAYEL